MHASRRLHGSKRVKKVVIQTRWGIESCNLNCLGISNYPRLNKLWFPTLQISNVQYSFKLTLLSRAHQDHRLIDRVVSNIFPNIFTNLPFSKPLYCAKFLDSSQLAVGRLESLWSVGGNNSLRQLKPRWRGVPIWYRWILHNILHLLSYWIRAIYNNPRGILTQKVQRVLKCELRQSQIYIFMYDTCYESESLMFWYLKVLVSCSSIYATEMYAFMVYVLDSISSEKRTLDAVNPKPSSVAAKMRLPSGVVVDLQPAWAVDLAWQLIWATNRKT